MNLFKNLTEFLLFILTKMNFTFKGKDVGILFYNGSEKEIREFFDELVNKGYDLDKFVKEYQLLTLFQYYDYKKIYKILLEYGVDINYVTRDHMGRNCSYLLTCLDDNHPEIAKRLITLKADVNLEIRQVNLLNAIQDFDISDRLDLFKLLINNGADVMEIKKNDNFIDNILRDNLILDSYPFYKRSSSRNLRFDLSLNEYSKKIKEESQFSIRRYTHSVFNKLANSFFISITYAFNMSFCFLINLEHEKKNNKNKSLDEIVSNAFDNTEKTYNSLMSLNDFTSRYSRI